jgi:hypothetical protein
MKRERKYLYLILLALGVLIYVEASRPTPIDWSESYTGTDRVPYGCYAMRELLGELFPGEEIVTASMPVYSVLEEGSAEPRNYIFINSSLHLDELDRDRLLEFVENGGSVFIAASDIGDGLLDTLGLESEGSYITSGEVVEVDFVNPALRTAHPYRFEKLGSREYFSDLDTARTSVLGTTLYGEPDFIRVRHGEGAFYLNLLPLAFTNFHLLDSAKTEYAFRALSYLPAAATIWDEHYKDGRRESRTPLRYLLGQEALRWGYYLLLAGVALFVLVHARRRQRIIPEIAPPVNATMDFVDTVGMLYLQGGDHAGIARKQIAYLLEQMRSSYGVKTEEMGEELYESVAKRSGAPAEHVRALFALIRRIEPRESINEAELAELNGAIEKFNNERER